MKKKVIELIRVSTEGQAASDRASIPAQKTVNARTAVAFGLDIVKTIQFSDVSGAAVLRSPEILQLIELMHDSEINGVVAREFSRLMRPENFADYALLQAFVDSNTVLYLPEGPLDLSSKTGRLMGTIRAAIAGLERTEILERVWSAKEEKRRRGELGQGKVVLPFGVDYNPGTGWSYKPEADRVREVFERFLAGETNYQALSKTVGVTPRGMHIIMRNPIWMGWRVIDKKRDTSAAGRFQKAGGRQSDRRKILRKPEDIIKVKVISEPLISEEQFNRVQQMMDLKQTRHWRTQPNITRRFTYNGFLNCAQCGALIYTSYRRADYYVCKNKRVGHGCSTKYMRRDKLESHLDTMFSERLTDGLFLEQLADSYVEQAGSNSTDMALSRQQAQISALQSRRDRVLDGYFEGVISREDRDTRVAAIDAQLTATQRTMLALDRTPKVTAQSLADAFLPFFEWEFLNRDDKRSLLSAVVPAIHVSDYCVSGISMLGGNENTRTAVAYFVAMPVAGHGGKSRAAAGNGLL